MAETLTTDPIMTLAQGQEVFDTRSENELIRLLNSLSAKARTFMNRTRLNYGDATAVIEMYRPEGASPALYLRAAAFVDGTHDMTVTFYSGATVQSSYTYGEGELVVTSDDYGTRVDLANGLFPACAGTHFRIGVEYFAGWATIPSDVYTGAILQGRVEVKRMAGEVGMDSHSRTGQSVAMDRGGVIKEVQDLWNPYKVWAC